MEKNKKYKVLEKSDPKDSIINLLIEIDQAFLSSYRKDSIKELSEEIEVDGFRKGHAPEKIVLEKVGEIKILEKNLFKAINTLLPVILADEKINALTMPNVSISKLAQNMNPEIKIEITIFPEVEISDYKKAAKEIKKMDPKNLEANEKDLEDYIQYLRESRATKKTEDGKEKELPEVTDEFVKSFGDFKDVEDFKTKIKENISADKKTRAEQKRRIEIMEKIISESKISVPQILIEEEKERMLMEFKSKVEGFKMNFGEYLSTIKKTEDDLKKEWEKDALMRTKMNLLLPKIAQAENIKPDEEQVNHEVKHIMEEHKGVDEMTVKVYVLNILTNQKVFEFLENL
jgi:FKBP-type peptidyl-prolyl cis-trans isomerase (trigger factor)